MKSPVRRLRTHTTAPAPEKPAPRPLPAEKARATAFRIDVLEGRLAPGSYRTFWTL